MWITNVDPAAGFLILIQYAYYHYYPKNMTSSETGHLILINNKFSSRSKNSNYFTFLYKKYTMLIR